MCVRAAAGSAGPAVVDLGADRGVRRDVLGHRLGGPGFRPAGWRQRPHQAQGNHLVQKINGLTTVDVTDNQPEKAAKDGLIALQLHVGAPMMVQFKDIKLKEVK